MKRQRKTDININDQEKMSMIKDFMSSVDIRPESAQNWAPISRFDHAYEIVTAVHTLPLEMQLAFLKYVGEGVAFNSDSQHYNAYSLLFFIDPETICDAVVELIVRNIEGKDCTNADLCHYCWKMGNADDPIKQVIICEENTKVDGVRCNPKAICAHPRCCA